MDRFNCEFYENFHSDIKCQCWNNDELKLHYQNFGINEGRKICEQDFYSIYPNFDYEFYENFHIGMKSLRLNKYQLMGHYYHYGINEGRQICEEDFYSMYPDFDYEFYENFHSTDIKEKRWNKYQIMGHYYIHGIKERRLICEKNFYSIYPNFDYEFYENYHTGMKSLRWNKYQLMGHYYHYGINEGRQICEQDFYSMCPDFDYEFYENSYSDIKAKGWNKYQIMGHYYINGIKERRLICEKVFYKEFPDFDIEYYKDFNKEISNLSYIQILGHCYIINKKYLNYDFVVNNDYTVLPQNDYINNLIINHYYYRNIDTIEKLVEYRNQFEKKFFICNKKSFYEYYDDFDFEFYKNKYFLNNECDEKEILLYYHSTGRYKNDKINDKIKIIIYCPPYNLKCGGIIVMHYLCYLINNFYSEKAYVKLFMHNNIKYDNPFCNKFARLDEINDNCFVIYPEIVSGNPLNAKNVIRWILLELGIEMPLDHYKKWNSTDLIYHWEKIDKQLTCPFFNPLFKNNNTKQERTKTCYLVKKGPLIHKNMFQIHPSGSICIDDFSLSEIKDLFNECKFFYSYDPNTAYIIYAAVCGCIPIIHEIDGINEDNYFKEKMFNFDNQIYNRGIVYGNNFEKINYILENKLNENNEEYYRKLFEAYAEKTIPAFLNDLYKYIL